MIKRFLSIAFAACAMLFGGMAMASTIVYPYHLVADAGSYGTATATFKAQHALMAEARQTRIVKRSDLRTDSNGFRLASADEREGLLGTTKPSLLTT